MGSIRGRELKIFQVLDQIPVERFQLINYFFDATLRSNRLFFEGQANAR